MDKKSCAKFLKITLLAGLVLSELFLCIIFLNGSTTSTIKNESVTAFTYQVSQKDKNQQLEPAIVPTVAPTETPVPASTPEPASTPKPKDTEEQKKENSQPDKKNSVFYPIEWGDRTSAVASLTFDDGFDGASIERVLDSLEKANVKCTFFIVGDALLNYPDLWKRAVKQGNQICNHTKNHEYLSKLSDEAIRRQISGWEEIAKQVLGEEYFEKMRNEFPYLRLPGGLGSDNKRVLSIVNEFGYIPVNWSDETYYSILRHYNLGTSPVGPIADRIVSYIVGNTEKGSIVLLHFNPFDTARLDDIIKGIKDKGLALKLVSEMF